LRLGCPFDDRMDFSLLDDLVDIGGDFAGVALEAFSFADFLAEKQN